VWAFAYLLLMRTAAHANSAEDEDFAGCLSALEWTYLRRRATQARKKVFAARRDKTPGVLNKQCARRTSRGSSGTEWIWESRKTNSVKDFFRFYDASLCRGTEAPRGQVRALENRPSIRYVYLTVALTILNPFPTPFLATHACHLEYAASRAGLAVLPRTWLCTGSERTYHPMGQTLCTHFGSFAYRPGPCDANPTLRAILLPRYLYPSSILHSCPQVDHALGDE
jgi:hypothetical protein